MRVEGTCEFCGESGDWEVGLFANRGLNFRAVKDRPPSWAALFPWNRIRLPRTCTFVPSKLKAHGVTTRLACPNCVRDDTPSTEER